MNVFRNCYDVFPDVEVCDFAVFNDVVGQIGAFNS